MANYLHESSAFSSSSEKRYYDVFINHRGIDVKQTLARAIYQMLARKGVRAFLDDKELELGDPIPQVLEEAIRSASVHIAIFSPRYAESTWCLEELLLMLRTTVPIIPVFYCVQISDLRYVENGKYADTFVKYQSRYDLEKIEEWKKALRDVSLVSGSILLDVDNCDEEEKLSEIVDGVHRKLVQVPLEVATFPVGIDAALQDFESEVGFSTRSDNVHIVGILGMGGSGKTTLAKAVYNRKCYFRSSFLSKVREAASTNTLPELQRKLLKDFSINHSTFDHIDQGTEMLATHFRSMTVLIVLDDVDDVDQIHALLPQKMMHNLGRDSLVIVTTREKDVLTSWGISSIYQMKPLDPFNAKQLFCRHAFSHNNHDFQDLTERFVKACHGLPLSLKVLGAMLNGKNKERWENKLLQLSTILPNEIEKRLKLSCDALTPVQQQMFLDIACFFIGGQKSLVISIWDGSGWNGELGWEILLNKCLVGLDEKGNIDMHDHFRDLGRAIARDSPRNSPHRIWKEDQISIPGGVSVIRRIVTATYKPCRATYGGSYPPCLEHCMENLIKRPCIPQLQLLVVKGNDFREEFAELSRELLRLRWCDFNGSDLPAWLSLAKLSVLELYNPKNLKGLWQENVHLQLPLQLRELIIEIIGKVCFRGFPWSIGRLTHLKKIVLIGNFSSSGMRSLPEEFCQLRSLEFLQLQSFTALSSLPDDFGKLTNLRTLYLSTLGLTALPDSFKQLTALQSLKISCCIRLMFTSEMLHILEFMTELQVLSICFCPVEELPHLTNQVSLRNLELRRTSLRELPNIDHLTKLETLQIFDHLQLEELPCLTNQVSLRKLDLTSTALREIPNFHQLTKLETLAIVNCPNLTSLPRSLGELSSLTSLEIWHCDLLESLPETIGRLSNLRSLISYKIPLVELGLGIASPCGCNLKNLKHLSLFWKQVWRISIPDDCCSSLEELYVSDNDYLTQIKILPRNVRCIKMENSPKLKNMSGIGGLLKLERLELISCPGIEVLPRPPIGCKVTYYPMYSRPVGCKMSYFY